MDRRAGARPLRRRASRCGEIDATQATDLHRPVHVSRVAGADAYVTRYTTEWCGVCQRAEAFLGQSGVPFREWDVEKTEFGAIKFAQLGGSGVPLITVGSEKMTGFAATACWRCGKRRRPSRERQDRAAGCRAIYGAWTRRRASIAS